MSKTLWVVALAGLLATCGSAAEIAGPPEVVQQAQVVGDIEHVVRIETPGPWNSERSLNVTSHLWNRGTETIKLVARECHLELGTDIKFEPQAEFLGIVIPGCPEPGDSLTLRPGESSGSVFFAGDIQDAGRYLIHIRHALDPEIWTTLEIVLP